jgi:L-fuculose-phosphate aldolase
MHLVVYEKRPDVRAVVHAHPPVATGFAVAGIPLAQCILPEVVVSLGAVPVAEYGTPSTLEVCDAILPHVQNAEAFLLANHGAVTMGDDVFQAYYRMETVEHFAKILLTAQLLGNVNVLSPAQVEQLVEVRGKSGIKGRFPNCETCGYCGRSRPVLSQTATPASGADRPRDRGWVSAPGASASRTSPMDKPAGDLPDEGKLRDIIAAVVKELIQ